MADAILSLFNQPSQPTAQEEKHEWDDSLERCLKCGDKDWFAGPKCDGRMEPSKPAPHEVSHKSHNTPVNGITAQGVEEWIKENELHPDWAGSPKGVLLTEDVRAFLKSQPTAQDGMEFDQWIKNLSIELLPIHTESALAGWNAAKESGQHRCDCSDKSQCWEPCGELGNSEEHAKVSDVELPELPRNVPKSVEEFIESRAGVANILGVKRVLIDDSDLRDFMAGKVLVPMKPTRGMIAETVDEVFDGCIEDAGIIEDIYLSMLKAASKGGGDENL